MNSFLPSEMSQSIEILMSHLEIIGFLENYDNNEEDILDEGSK